MKQLIKKIAELCKDSIEREAVMLYDYDKQYFDGCSCDVVLEKHKRWIEIECDESCCHKVIIFGDNECPNIENEIAEYLDKNAQERKLFEDRKSNNHYSDCDPGCDPAFPRLGDFERWAYGRNF